MVQVVHRFRGADFDAEIGDIVTLKSGSPEGTIVGFGAPEPSTVPLGIANASYSEALPSAHVMWANKDGGIITSAVPLAALNLKARDKDAPRPAARPEPVI